MGLVHIPGGPGELADMQRSMQSRVSVLSLCWTSAMVEQHDSSVAIQTVALALLSYVNTRHNPGETRSMGFRSFPVSLLEDHTQWVTPLW